MRKRSWFPLKETSARFQEGATFVLLINFKTSNMFATLGVGTQGVDLDNWVTLYTVQWSEDGEAWVTYQEDGHDKVLNYF